jgi:hypothetical protein
LTAPKAAFGKSRYSWLAGGAPPPACGAAPPSLWPFWSFAPLPDVGSGVGVTRVLFVDVDPWSEPKPVPGTAELLSLVDFFDVVSVVGSSDVVSDVVVLFVDVSVLALFDLPSTLPSDVPPGRCEVELLLVFSGEPLTSSSPVIASMPIANTATVNPVITSSRRRDFGAPASTAGTAEMTSVA